MAEWTPEAREAWQQRTDAAEAVGHCPAAGMTIARCWGTELCDCSMTPPLVCPVCHVSVWDMALHHEWATHA
jgi:hypothetical protein